MNNIKVPVTIRSEDYEIEFDALMAQDKALSASVPEYSVEDGYAISDSIILSAETLNMTLFVTNTPVTWLSRHGGSTTRVSTVVQQLEELYYSKSAVEIVTSDATYTNMAIESITISKSLELGTSKEIPISFRKINITKSEVTTIPDSYGKSGTTKATAGTTSTSTSSSAVDDEYNSILSLTEQGMEAAEEVESSGKGSILYNAASSFGLIK